MMKRTILVVVGYIGSGKSEVSGYIESLGIPMYRTGDVIRKAVLDSGRPLNPKNSEMMAVELRKRHGMDVAARRAGRVIKAMDPKEYPIICVEGPRDMFEIDYLAKLGKVVLLVVKAPLKLRYERANSRKTSKLEPRSREARDFEEFKWRDKSENARGQKEVTHTGRYPRHVIRNTGTKKQLHSKVNRLIKTLKQP